MAATDDQYPSPTKEMQMLIPGPLEVSAAMRHAAAMAVENREAMGASTPDAPPPEARCLTNIADEVALMQVEMRNLQALERRTERMLSMSERGSSHADTAGRLRGEDPVWRLLQMAQQIIEDALPSPTPKPATNPTPKDDAPEKGEDWSQP